MQKSLFGKYLRNTMIIVFSSFVVLGSVMMVFFSGYTKNDKRKLLTQSANSMASITSAVDITNSGTPQLLGLFVQSFSLNIDADIFVTDLEGTVLFGAYANSTSRVGTQFTPFESVPPDIVACAAAGSFSGTGRKNGIYKDPYYVIGVPLYASTGDKTPVGAVFAATNATTLTEYQFAAFQMFLIAAAAAFVLAFCVVGLFSYRLVKPLRQMSAAAKSFGNGDFSMRVPVTSSDEIGQLALAFNNMADSLSNSESMNRSFVANVSHELKTPMTTIAGFIDGILDGTIPPDMQNHYLQLVSEETGRLARLIQNMLDLSKLESGEYQVNARMFNIWETLTGVALSAEQRINDGMIELEGLTMDEKVLVYADPDLIHQVAYNLLDNAIKFTPAGGTIRFHVEKLGPEVEVSIWNSGQGISPEALPYVFQRFYKEDRSRGLHARGAGLGLNICKVLVNLSGGQIRVESQQGEWCRFVFTLPTCPPNPGEIKRLPDEAGRPVPVEDPASMKPVN